jgi:predicted ABC-type ATPase
MPDESPTLLLIGGCNGAGKTTFARRLLPAENIERFLNADELARGLSPLKPEVMAMRAGRLLLEEARRLIESKMSFGLESTLSGKTYARLLEQAKKAGFLIVLHFLVVPSPEVSIGRVAQRVRKGGHHVPDEDIRRRFRRSVENFLQTYAPLADAWMVWDNEGGELKSIADSRNDSYDDLVTLLERMTLKEDKLRVITPSMERAMHAAKLAYEDAKAENARWGLPMIPQEWDPRVDPVILEKKKGDK